MPFIESDSKIAVAKIALRSKLRAIDWAVVVAVSIYLIAVARMWWAIRNRTGHSSGQCSPIHQMSQYVSYDPNQLMEHASRILLEIDATVKSVAAALGFKDPSHFSCGFKSVHHVPPSRFRQSMHPQWPS